jgi:hypothetical protein
LPNVREDVRQNRHKCELLGIDFIAALSTVHPIAASQLKQHEVWWKDLKNLRDPAAHRIPLYVPPSVIRPEDVATYHALEKQLDAAVGTGLRRWAELEQRQRELMEFQPVMVLTESSGIKPRPLVPQMTDDLSHYNDIVNCGLAALRSCS